MKYDEWETEVPTAIREDSLWKMKVYRVALFLSDVAWYDTEKLIGDYRGRSLADQLYRAVGSISANISEGYSRPTERDQARFYSYALGSAREARDWYHKSRHLLGIPVVEHRMAILVQIIRQLIAITTTHRGKTLREDTQPYTSDSDPLSILLDNILPE